MFQSVVLTGRVGRDAELRYTSAGKPVLNFSLAVDTGYGDNKETQWWACAMWGERGEKLHTHIVKGKVLTVQGETRGAEPRTWQGKDGTTRAEWALNVTKLAFVGGGKGVEAEEHESDNIPF